MIILIDNYDSFTFNLYQMLSSFGEEVNVIRNDRFSADEILLMKPDGIVISPGPKTPKDAGICLELIQKAAGKVPILGVCLGMQAIAEAFGGKVVSAKNPVHGKKETIFHDRKDLYGDMPLPFTAGRYHSLIVEKKSLPSDLLIAAESSEGIVMGIKHVSLPIYGVQFHPESILSEKGENILKFFAKEAAHAKALS